MLPVILSRVLDYFWKCDTGPRKESLFTSKQNKMIVTSDIFINDRQWRLSNIPMVIESKNKHATSDQRCNLTIRGEGGGYPVIIHYLGHGLYNIP